MSRGLGKLSLEIIAASYEILSEIQPATVRAVCYKLFVQRLILSMAKSETNKISRLLRIARERSEIPWEWIVDETREAERVAAWDNPRDYAQAVIRSYRRDYWSQQPIRVEVWSEKGTVRGTTYLYELINSGELESFKDGKARKITVASIHAYIERRLTGAKKVAP